MENTFNTLMTPLEESLNNNGDIQFYLDYLCTLEGFKTKIKNLHWSASGLNIHKELDELSSTVSSYQDEVAEDVMGVYEQVLTPFLKGTPCECTSPLDLIINLRVKAIEFYNGISIKPECVGVKSETETFIHDLNKFKYLFKLCKG